MKFEKILAWGVHSFTALGLVLAAFVAVLVVRSDAEGFRLAFFLLFLACLIDGADGWLARRLDVNRVLPAVDGRRMDDIIDFHTYTSLPLFLLWKSSLIPPEHAAWLLVPLIASAYGFSQAEAKTRDGYFLGFPSFWNVIVFYLYFLKPPVWFSLTCILGFAALTFVPAKYLYPSQPGVLNRLTILLGLIWALMLLLILFDVPEQSPNWVLASLFFPVYYLFASWTITVRDRWHGVRS